MLASISSLLQDECHLDASHLLVVGVSGGPDSLCLLDVLHRLGYPLLVAHVNHRLRSEASDEQKLVEQAAMQRGLPFVATEVDVMAYAGQESLTVEEAARNLRYGFLFDEARQHHAQAVVVGHNADDQVETVLMHLLRGSGLAGLRGMPVRALPNVWSSEIPLLRPLLHTWRSEIEAYCRQNNLHPVQDKSNLQPFYTRNRLRLELIPSLENIQPGVRGSLLRLARLVSAEDDLLQEVTQAAWQECLRAESGHYLAFDLSAVQDQPVAIQRRLLRRAAGLLRYGLSDLSFDDIERARQFVCQPTQTRQLDWISGLRLVVEAGNLWIAGWEADLPTARWPQLVHDQQFTLHAPGQVVMPGGWVLRAEFVELNTDGHQHALLNSNPYQTWLDADRLELPLQLRGRQSGDLFAPLGMHGQEVSLRDWMIKQKLPQRARRGWPLLCSGEQIVWIPGFLPSHAARLTSDTQRILYLRLVKENAESL